jgi:DNA end-binding protein Ku
MPRKSSHTEPVAASPPATATLPTNASTPRGRPSWSGILRLSLVTVPVKAYPATSSSDAIHFHQLHADCGQRITYEKRCPLHGAVEASQIVKGYQYASGQYVILQAEELESLRSARDQALSLERFVDPGEIDPVVFSGRCLYLLPESGPAQRPYLLLAQVMRARHRWGLGRVVLSGHRHAVVLRPWGRLLAMDVLHEPSLVRSAAWLEAELQQVDASPEELQLAEMLIHSASGPLDWQPFRDDTPDKLAALVAAKVAGQQVISPVEEPFSVLPLLDALKQSVARTQSASATAEPAGPAAKRRRSA